MLEAVGLYKTYNKRAVVHDVSFNVAEGEVVCLLGPNGAGKTTSFYMTVGAIKSDKGKIFLNGIDVTKLPLNKRVQLGIGYLPQENSVFRGLSAQDNIMLVLELLDYSHKKRLAILNKILNELRISGIRSNLASSLSGGERRRVEIGRILALKPNFVLLDEPFAGVDPIAVKDIREIISYLKGKGIGILITDHNVRETLKIVDRAYIMHDGRILFQGTPESIVNNEDVRSLYLGNDFSL